MLNKPPATTKPPAKRARDKDVCNDDPLCSQASIGSLFSSSFDSQLSSTTFPQFSQPLTPTPQSMPCSPASPASPKLQLSVPLTQTPQPSLEFTPTKPSQSTQLQEINIIIEAVRARLGVIIGKMQGRARLTRKEIAKLVDSLAATHRHAGKLADAFCAVTDI